MLDLDLLRVCNLLLCIRGQPSTDLLPSATDLLHQASNLTAAASVTRIPDFALSLQPDPFWVLRLLSFEIEALPIWRIWPVSYPNPNSSEFNPIFWPDLIRPEYMSDRIGSDRVINLDFIRINFYLTRTTSNLIGLIRTPFYPPLSRNQVVHCWNDFHSKPHDLANPFKHTLEREMRIQYLDWPSLSLLWSFYR